MKKQLYYIIVALFASLFIYLFYRTEKTVVNEIVIYMVSFNVYTTLKQAVIQFLPLNELIIYSLPEGLWVFCITLTSKPYYIQLKNWQINCVAIPLIFCISLEFFQLLHFTNGQFDLMDILVSVIFWLIGAFSFDAKPDKQNILSPLNARRMVCFITYGIVYLSHVLE